MSKHKNLLIVLFGSKARVKILKFLFRNQGMRFTAKELADRVQESASLVNREIRNFFETGLIKIVKK